MSAQSNILNSRHRRSLTKGSIKVASAAALSGRASSAESISDVAAARLWRELGKSAQQFAENRAAYRKELQDEYEEGERLLKEILG